jgi:WD40 repeat protein
LIQTINGNGESEYPVKLVSLDETHLAVGYSNRMRKEIGKTIRILNWETGGEFGQLRGHSLSVVALTKLEESHLASGSEDMAIKIWHWTSGRLVQNLTKHTSRVNGLISIKNFTILVSCSNDKTIQLWNRTNGKLIQTLKDQQNSYVNCIILLNNGHLASGSWEISIWDMGTTKACVIRISTGHLGSVKSLTNIDQLRMASCDALDLKIKIWRVDLGTEIKALLGHHNWIFDLILLPNGHLVSSDNMIHLWDLEKYSLVKIINSNYKQVISFDLLNGNLVSGSKDGTIKIWYFDQKNTNYTKSKFFSYT